MKRLRLAIPCAVLVVASLVLAIGGCSSPAPAPKPTTAPAPTAAPAPSPTTAPAPKPTTAASPSAPQVKLPDMFVLTGYTVGTAGYVFSAALGDAVSKNTGKTVRIVPAATDIGKVLPARAGEVQMFMIGGSTAFYIAHGMGPGFSNEEWGPQPIRVAWAGTQLNGCMVGADAKVKTFADLKGKKFARWPGLYGADQFQRAFLAFGGLDFKDTIEVQFNSYGDGTTAIVQGKADAGYAMTTSAGAIELAGSPRGLYWIPMPASDKEGWKRFIDIAPHSSPAKATRGANLSKDKPAELSSAPYPILAYASQNPDYIYAFAKGIWDGYDLYKDKNPELLDWTHEVMTDYKRLTYPYHDGVVRLFKEKGVWSNDMAKWQDEVVAQEQARMKAWGEAKTAAAAQKITIGSEKWSAFWETWLREKKLMTFPRLG